MAVNWIESEIIEHTHWTDTLSSLRFKGEVLPYTAGQFTKVGLKINGEVVSLHEKLAWYQPNSKSIYT